VKLLSPLFLTVSLIVTAGIVLTPALPLGVTGVAADGSPMVEWVWQRHRPFGSFTDAIDRLLPALFSGIVLLVIGRWGASRIDRAGTLRLVAMYALLIVTGWFWILQVQQTPPMEHRETKPLWVLYDPSSAGYFFEAAFRMPSTAEFLAGYEARMEEGEVLHVGTHPPGLFLLSKLCLTLSERIPGWAVWMTDLHSSEQLEAFRLLEREARFARPLTDNEVSALQMLSQLSNLAIALTMIPLAVLGHLMVSRQTTWWLNAVWVTLPCLAVFAPKSDVLFAFTGTAVLAAGIKSMTKSTRASWAFAALAGFILWIGLMLSLAHLPVLVLLCCCVGIRAIHNRLTTVRHDCMMLGVLLAVIMLASLLFWLITDCNILNVWRWNLTNHAGFYDQFTRTWWKWLLVNPIELALAVGIPVAVLAAAGLCAGGRNLWNTLHFRMKERVTKDAGAAIVKVRDNDPVATSGNWASLFCVSAAATFAALWLSGKNQGEAARLWCFLTPWLLLSGGLAVNSCVLKPNTKESMGATLSIPTCLSRLLIIQILIGMLTVSHVSGFSF
jgi:methylthioxylose transferase